VETAVTFAFSLGNVPVCIRVDLQIATLCREKWNTMMEVEDLQTFVEVADAGGVSPAARRLGVHAARYRRDEIRLRQMKSVIRLPTAL
jgi:hypothetical protein